MAAEGGAVGRGREEEEDSEKTTFGNCAKHKTKYGSTTSAGGTCSSPDNAEFYIKHQVQDGESLVSVALRYGLKNSHLQRVNHLWNDCIFLRAFLYIPVASRECIPGDYSGEILTKADLHANRLHHSQSDTNANSKAEVGCETNGTDLASTADYFRKFDTSLAQIKNSLEEIEKRSNLPQDSVDVDNPLTMLSRKKSGSNHRSWSAGIEPLDPSREPEMRFLSQPSSSRVRTSTRERLEKTQDEIFQL